MDRRDFLTNQLDRTLGFFGRVEQKASLIFGSNIGLLAVTLINLDYLDLSAWYVSLPLFAALILIAISFANLYQAAYPSLDGGHDSLIYFNEIAKKTEANYLERFLASSDQEIERDLLGQIWRNSQILQMKFACVKRSFQLTLISLVPLVIFLFTSSYIHARVVRVG